MPVTSKSSIPGGRTPSEEQWLRINDYLRGNRYRLAVEAAGEYPDAARLAGTPLLSDPAWRLPAPIPLASIGLEFRPQTPLPVLPATCLALLAGAWLSLRAQRRIWEMTQAQPPLVTSTLSPAETVVARVPCPICHGARYNAETLEINYRGKNIAEVLSLTVDQAWDFFSEDKSVQHPLSVLREVGLGYLRLGQAATEQA